jgi:hypothetical protein
MLASDPHWLPLGGILHRPNRSTSRNLACIPGTVPRHRHLMFGSGSAQSAFASFYPKNLNLRNLLERYLETSNT